MTSLTIFNNDTSTQLDNTTFSYLPSYSSASNPSILFNDGTSGIYNATANTIIFYTSGTTALTIDTNQCIYGNGTGLTNIGYNNVIGKPSFFPADWNTTVSNRPDLTVYSTNTNLNSLSTFSKLNIDNLKSTSTTIFNNLNNFSSASTLLITNLNSTCSTILNNLNSFSTFTKLNIDNLNSTSTTIFNNLNSFSGASTLSINNLNATSTTILSRLNSLSTNSTLSINNLNATSTTILGYINSLSTNSILSINNLNATSTTIFTNLNSLSTNSTLSINNLNATSTTIFTNLNSFSTFSTLSINNLNATSTTLFTNLNSLSSASTLSINNLNATSTTIFTNLNSLSTNSTLSINNLNATSTTLFTNLNSSSTNSTLSINNLNATSTTIFTNLNSLSTYSNLNISNLQATSTSLLNKTNFTNLLVSGASTINSTLNIKGREINEGLSIVDASTYIDQYQLLINAPTLTTNSTIQTIKQNLGYNQILDLQPNGGSIKLSQNTTALSSLNVSGNTTLNNITTINSSLNVSGNTTLNNVTTCRSTLNVSGNTTLSNVTTINSTLNVSGITTFSNKVGIGITPPIYVNLDVLGVANIHNGTRFAALNYTLNPGSLIIGSTGLNYGGGTNWNGGNAAGLMMECNNDTEIVVHDNGNRLASLMYYEGNTTNRLTIGRNMGWDVISSLQVGNAGRLKIGSGTTDYSLIGTLDTDGATNTRIVISGNTRPSFSGNIDYVATSTGKHIFYTTNTTQIRLTIDDNVNITGTINANGDKLNFPNTLNQYKINLWGTNNYGFGIAASTLQYSSQGNHTFYNSGTNAVVFNISSTGAITVNDHLTVGSYANAKYTYLGGLRIGGWDGNTLYQDTGDLGITVHNTTPKITFNFFGGNNTIMDIKNTSINFYQPVYFKNDVWHSSGEGAYRLYFGGSSGTTYLAGGNTDANGLCTMFMSGSVSGFANLMSIYNNGNIIMGLSSTNSAFLIVHGSIACRLFSVNKTNTDYVGTQGNRPNQGSTILDTLCNLYDTFTGMHRCFTEDELYNKEDPQKFKDDYVGRIVISSGKIATDISNENNGWDIYYDKDGITSEDAVPMIELSRTKKDKRVFGVMGSPTRKNSRNERMIINSIGEGPILVCNSNGNIENGDYITSSDHLGYGEKQDDDLLHNYTVAKSTIDCSFELDNPYYNCFELEGTNYRVAFIACTYHCG